MTSTVTKANKKTWQRPALQTYGTIGVMTNATDMMGNADGGGGMMTKT